MKKNLTTVLVATWLGACSTVPEPSMPGEARVLGEVAGVEIAEVRINGAPPRLDDGWSNTADPNDVVVPVGPDGGFEIPLALEAAKFFRLTAGRRTVELFLEPGDVSRVSVSPDAEGSGEPAIEFDGDGAALNRFVIQQAERLAESERYIGRHARELFALDPAGFADRVEGLRRKVLDEHAAFVGSQGVPAAFARRTAADVDFWFRRLEMIYPSVHHEMTGEHAPVPASYLDDLASGTLDRLDALSSSPFVGFLNEYVKLSSAGELKYSTRDLPREKLLSRYEAIARLAAPAEIKEYLLEQMFRNFRISYGPRDWGRVLAALERDEPGSSIAAAVRPLWEEDMARREEPDEIVVFREAGDVELEAHVFYPADLRAGDRRAAYLFFHGGGWAIGTPEWGYAACRRAADLGLVAVSFEYRLADVHGTDLFAGVEDVQSAIAWARSRAGDGEGELPIDPARVVAAGFSAGGHLAGASAILELRVPHEPDPRPDALIIHSSSYDLTKGRFFDAMTGGRAESVSLTHQVAAGLVPTILFHGRYDHLAPLEEFQGFVDRMEALGNDFEQHLFDVGHFFRDEEARRRVHELTEAFLARRGFIDG